MTVLGVAGVGGVWRLVWLHPESAKARSNTMLPIALTLMTVRRLLLRIRFRDPLWMLCLLLPVPLNRR